MSLLKRECRVMGINPVLISAALALLIALSACFIGELIDLSALASEVIFPFYAAIAVGEWGKTRADEAFDCVAAQGRSLFCWAGLRFLTVFLTVSVFAVPSMAVVSFARGEIPFWEMLPTYFSPAFFLASFSALLGICFSQEHIASLICGVAWLLALMTRSLLRYPGVEYGYLFIRFAGDENGIWQINKLLLFCTGIALWAGIFALCRKRSFLLNR